MSRVLSVLLALLAVASAQPAAAEPSSQAAFRAVLLKYDQRADAEIDPNRLRTLAAERSAELAQVLGQGLAFNGWDLILSGSEATPMGGIFVRLLDATLNAPRFRSAIGPCSGDLGVISAWRMMAPGPEFQ